MQGTRDHARRCTAALVFGLLAACGGGGGGSSGEARPPTTADTAGATNTVPDVSVTLESGMLRDSTYEGVAAHNQIVSMRFEGDTSILAGRTIYTKIVQPEPVYVRMPQFDAVHGQSRTVALYPNEAHALAAGHTAGTLQVFVCLDPDCATQVQNSPLLVDYDIEVRRGLEFSAESIVQSTTYGTPLPPRSLTIAIPAEADGWSFSPSNTLPGASASSLALVPGWMKRNGNTLTFDPPADLLPGVYALEFGATTFVPDSRVPSQRVVLRRTLLVSHTVVATGPYAATPAAIEVTKSLSGLPVGTPVPRLVSQVGGVFTRRGVRTDSFPAAAAGHPVLPGWLSFFDSIDPAAASLTYCHPTAFPRECLPLGTYRGALLLRHTDTSGVATDFEIPVTMSLVP